MTVSGRRDPSEDDRDADGAEQSASEAEEPLESVDPSQSDDDAAEEPLESDDEVIAAVGRRRRSLRPVIAAGVVGCVAALLIAVLATSKNASTTPTVVTTPLQNKPAPNISGPLVNGGSASLGTYRGKWVLVNFFASWCVPCQQEQADLVKFQNAHASGNAVIFGVRFDDPDTGPINQLMSKSGAKWPVVDDPNAKIDYSVTGPPESFLISPGGIVLAHIVGPVTDAQLEQILNQEELVVTTPAAGTTPPSTTTPSTTTGP